MNFDIDLPRKRVGYCRKAARKLLERFALRNGELKPPIPVWNIAEIEGFEIHLMQNWSDKQSALVNHAEKLIGINRKHHPHRQRFSLGHEIGHIVLQHPAESELGDEENRLCDREADEFAGELLVPYNLLKIEIEKNKDVDNLARIFNVSTQVITIRLISQNLLREF